MKLKPVAIFALASCLTAWASQATLTGILTDDMCTKKHMIPGKSNAECVRECVKGGAKYVVVSEGKAIELQGEPEKLNELAGKKIKVTGNLTGKTLAVASVELAQ
jgi:predicted transposase YbfD/YdcC